MCGTLRPGFMALLLAAVPLAGQAAPPAADQPIQSATQSPIQSVWMPQEIRYSYVGFTAAYSCTAAESRLKDILLALGAHPQTKVRANGCYNDRPSKSFFISITTATPVAAKDMKFVRTEKSEQALIEKLGGAKAVSSEPFPAQWQTVNLSRDRKLNLKPGDCELMQGLRDSVLPKLSIKVVADGVQCVPHQLTIQTPELTVSALVPVPSADVGKPVA